MKDLTIKELDLVNGGVVNDPSEETQAGAIGGLIGSLMGSAFGGVGSIIGGFIGAEVGMYAVDNAKSIVQHSGALGSTPVANGAIP